MEILAKQLDSGIPVPCALTVCTQGVCKHGGGTHAARPLYLPKAQPAGQCGPPGTIQVQLTQMQPPGNGRTGAIIVRMLTHTLEKELDTWTEDDRSSHRKSNTSSEPDTANPGLHLHQSHRHNHHKLTASLGPTHRHTQPAQAHIQPRHTHIAPPD